MPHNVNMVELLTWKFVIAVREQLFVLFQGWSKIKTLLQFCSNKRDRIQESRTMPVQGEPVDHLTITFRLHNGHVAHVFKDTH